MSLKNKLEAISDKIGGEYIEHVKILENHMITMQENQVEGEQYLKDITERLIRIEAKIRLKQK